MASRLDSILSALKISRRDMLTFLMSLLLAFGVWLLYNLNQDYSAILTASVSVESNLPGRFPRCESSVVVEARLGARGYEMLRGRRGRKPVLLRIDPELFTDEGDGMYSLPASVLSAHVGEIFRGGVRLESFTSPSYTFRFNAENNKLVPVVPVTSLSFKSQYMERGTIALQPDSVMVYGDPSYLENLDRVYTSRISYTKLSSPVTGNVDLEKVRGVRLSHPSVRYSIDVTRFVEVRRNVSVSLLNAPAGADLSVYPSTADVTFRCAFPVTADRSGEVRFYIDYQDFLRSAGGKCVARSSPLPQGVLSYRIEPEVFECLEGSR